MTRLHVLRLLATLQRIGPIQRRQVFAALPPNVARAVIAEWWWQARGGQLEPSLRGRSDWRIWSIVAGRGFGKTRAGAEWVWQRARDHPGRADRPRRRQASTRSPG